MDLGAPAAVSGCVCVAVSVWVGVWVCGVWGRIFGCCCMFGSECVHVMEGGCLCWGVLTTPSEEQQSLFTGSFKLKTVFKTRKWQPGCHPLPAGQWAEQG